MGPPHMTSTLPPAPPEDDDRERKWIIEGLRQALARASAGELGRLTALVEPEADGSGNVAGWLVMLIADEMGRDRLDDAAPGNGPGAGGDRRPTGKASDRRPAGKSANRRPAAETGGHPPAGDTGNGQPAGGGGRPAGESGNGQPAGDGDGQPTRLSGRRRSGVSPAR